MRSRSCPKGHTDFYEKSGNCRTCIRERSRISWRSNPQGQRARSKKWRDENKDRERARWRQWSKQNPEKRRALAHKRAARVRGAAGEWTPEDIALRYKAQKGKCAYHRVCGQRLGDSYHCDHIVPLAKGGTFMPSNLQLTCRSCNLRKHAQDAVDFARKIGLLL